MAAVPIHVAKIKLATVDPSGNVIDKRSATTTIGMMANSSTEQRIVPDAAIPSSASSPNIEDYLKAEAAAGYVLRYLGQTYIVTYSGVN